MKILHCCLSCFYIDNYNYQENMLVRQHVQSGHEVSVLASTENYDSQGKLSYCAPGDYIGGEGAHVFRLPYRKILPHALIKKIRAYPDVYRHLCAISPDVIVFHGACAWELLTVVKYKKSHPAVRLYVDSHEDFNNSARGFLSKNLLHAVFYRSIFRSSIPFFEKLLCISVETMRFMEGFYGCPKEKIEYFPLGGEIFPDSTYEINRSEVRNKLNVTADALVFVQSGKFDKKKKLTESIKAFQSLPFHENVKYFIAGVLQDDVRAEVEALIAGDDRITFLGWTSGGELMKLLCAADVYLQPGSQSATLQNSICCRCSVIVDDVPSHHPFVKDNGWMVRDADSLVSALGDAILAFQSGKIKLMQARSLDIAKQLLDYGKMARRLTE